MNYLKLKALIIAVTVAALAISVLALIVGLVLPQGILDLQGASGLASIIPAFAGVLIAAFALYSYNKLEDADYAKARQMVAARDELVSQLRLAAHSVATAVRLESATTELQKERMLREYAGAGKFRSPDGKEYTAKDPDLAKKLIGAHAAGLGRVASNLQLKAALDHLEGQIVQSMTMLTPLVLDHFKDQDEKTRTWLTSFQAIIYGCQAFDQVDQRQSGLANIVRGSKDVAGILKDPFFSSATLVYKALTAGVDAIDVPASIVEMLDDLDGVFSKMAKPSEAASDAENATSGP